MSDEDYIEPRIVESAAVCAALSRLPRLPVRGLVLSQDSVVTDHVGRTVAQRILRTADELGVGGAIVVEERSWNNWAGLESEAPMGRFDIVFFRPDGLAPDPSRLDASHPWCADVLAAVLEGVSARFWTLDQHILPEVLEQQEQRANHLCMQVLARGGAPSVRLPAAWEAPARAEFLVRLFEYALHDAPLTAAATRAWDRDLEPPELFLPEGRRHGLDLARLLESHRSRIQELATSLRILQREVEAARPGGDHAEGWGGVREAMLGRQDALSVIRDSCEEIDRDRDPAGWSRLSADIEALRRLEAAVEKDRGRLESIARGVDSPA